jgi:membrane fusion protein, copper/silver efflux system
MNTRKKLNSICFFGLLLIFTVLSSCKNKHENHQQETNHEQHSGAVYTCPMHPEIISNQPGNCPICKMKLVLVEEKLIQTVSPSKQVLSRQATVKLQSGINGEIIKTQGYITTDPNRNKSVAARFSGRIEKLYVKFSNQYVKQGDKIMDIYSPDLRTFQEEHLFILKSNNENSLIEKSREKLRLLGLTDSSFNYSCLQPC